jgi:hypothetical protein
MPNQAKGINGLISMQYEGLSYGTSPAIPDLTKIYFETEGFKGSRNAVTSNVQTGNRQPTRPTQGNVDVAGSIATELMAYPGMLFNAALGSIATTMIGTGEVLGTALTAPTAVIDPYNLLMTVTATAHGVVVGDTVNIAGITIPLALNGLYCRCVAVTSANIFVVRIPLGINGIFTLGVGTLKRVTTPATAYQHVMKAGGVLPALVVEKGFPDAGQYFFYNGIKCSKMALGITPEGFQKLSFDYMGKKETVSGATFDSTVIDLGKTSFTGFQITTLEEGGIPIATVTKIDISLDNGLDGTTFTVGGMGTRGALNEGTAKLTGTAEAFFQDVVLYTKAVNSTETSLKTVYFNGTGAGTVNNESFELFAPELIFTQQTPTISGDKGILISLPFEAYYDNNVQGTVLQITLKTPQLAI